MPAGFRHAVEQIRPQLIAECFKLPARKLAQVGRAVNGVKQRGHVETVVVFRFKTAD